MKLIFLLIFTTLNLIADDQLQLKEISELYFKGSYQEALIAIEKKNSSSALMRYWEAVTLNKLQEYEKSVIKFDEALKLGATVRDLNYEYGQALYALEKLKDAREQFKLSYKKGFKKSVSLYYVGYITKELGERKTAYKILKSIRQIEDEDKTDVIQATEFMLGDLLADEIKQHHLENHHAGDAIVKQYRRALDIDTKSKLAPLIQDKINENLSLYDIALLRLSNGRPAIYPPYLLKVLNETGIDSNVTFNPTETTVARSKQKSTFNRFDVFGRYTFYHHNYLSVTPEFRFNKTYYFHRVPEIYRNDNESMTFSLRNGYEHTLKNKPATLLIDYEFNHSRRDLNSEKKLRFSSRSHTIMVGERVNLFSFGETIVRLRNRMFESYLNSRDARSLGFSLEQLQYLSTDLILYSAGLEDSRVHDKVYNTKSINLRFDYILARFRDILTPTIGFAFSKINPVNNMSQRGTEYLLNPSVRVTKAFFDDLRVSLKYDYQKYQSKDKLNFAYKKDTTSIELEYLF